MARFGAAPLAYLSRAKALATRADARDLAASYFEAVVLTAPKTHAAEAARAMLPSYHAARAQAAAAPAWEGLPRQLDSKICALAALAER